MGGAGARSVGVPPGDIRRELLNSASWPASDEAVVDALLGFANGAEVVMLSKPRAGPASTEEKRGHPRAPIELRERYRQLLQCALDDPDELLAGFMPLGTELLISLKVRPVMQLGTYGFALDYFREFPDLQSALTYGLMLILDTRKPSPGAPYLKALSRCQLPRCGRFYLAQRKKGGGPANRIYCSPEHRTEHHNSASRKAATKPRARHK